VLGFVAVTHEPALLRRIPKLDFVRIRELLRLGVPAAGQILLEVGVFAASTLFAGRLAPEALAAHHVILNLVGTTFMVPLGISSAGAVTVGQSIGRGDSHAARLNGWLAIGLAGVFMLFAATVFAAIPQRLIMLFTRNSDVLEIAVPLLSIAAVFQLFDGVQVSTTGVLRGAGDTRTPMLCNLMGHWLLGLPIGYLLCFRWNYGVFGLWLGLSMGLIVVGAALLVFWARLRLQLRSAPQSATHSS
jgi:multidrug resistance protein, MATE family